MFAVACYFVFCLKTINYINGMRFLALMKAKITSFRGSHRRKYNNHMILQVEGVDSKEKASELVGKEVSWKSPAGKEIKGKVSGAHGSKGAVRAIFETGMPGQSLNTIVEVK